jgi:cytochrome c556
MRFVHALLLWSCSAALLLSVMGLCLPLALAHEGATGVVKERMDLMKRQQKDMKLLGEMAKGKTPFDGAKAAAAAKDLANTAKKIPDLFPQGSAGHPSDALPAIWEDWDHFTGNAGHLETNANALAEHLDGASGDGWTGALQKVTDSCKDCHESFRAKKTESGHH